MSNIAYVNDSDFDNLLESESLVVVDFTATWCGPCRKVAPLLEQLATEYQNQLKVVKVDVDQNKVNAKKFGIKSIPAVLIFKSGELVETLVGIAPYEKFSQAVQPHLG
ncbi:thioredoxin [Merismopedia glauca]|uniref:Thioredoxin n=1 Tax=Merismopedia glauca CCAP 1448/3 TaxID=1296344 RepID=A0A2T1C5W9_9CYAN|nr:thioredoxin [Merismopedia glauca]PSB03659.1 thioredoxin [Merismopedia glauca CCAP 1448/3]